MLRQIRPNTLP